MNEHSHSSDGTCCGMKGEKKEFDYCFWAKLLIAIPALPLVALLGMSLFTNEWMQVISGGVAVGLVVWFFTWIDTLPVLAKKVRFPKSE